MLRTGSETLRVGQLSGLRKRKIRLNRQVQHSSLKALFQTHQHTQPQKRFGERTCMPLRIMRKTLESSVLW